MSIRLRFSCLLSCLALHACSGNTTAPTLDASAEGGTGVPPVDDPSGPPVIDDGSVKAIAAASRMTGVAPLSVHFDGTGSTGGARPFHDLHYTWAFGDGDGSLWATTGHRKDLAYGAVAGHVFEGPGRYEVTLTVRDAAGKGAATKLTIEVLDPEQVFASSTTCFATGGDFTGCPTGAAKITTSDFAQVAARAAPGARLLLRRGDRWAVAQNLSLEGKQATTLGAFGACASPDARGLCANAPLLEATQVGLFVLTASDDVRVTELSLTGLGDGTEQVGVELLGGRGALVYRVRTRGFNVGITTGFNQEDLAVVECDVGRAYTNQVNVGSERLLVLGNHFHDTPLSHVLRVWHAYKGVIAENLLEHASVEGSLGRHALKLHGPGESEVGANTTPSGGPLHRTSLTVVSDNTFGASPPWPVSLGPQNVTSDERIEDVIFERNFWRTSGATHASSPPLDTALHCTATARVTVRNNIFEATGAGDGYAALDVSKSDGIPVGVSDVRFLNNLVYRSDLVGSGIRMARIYPSVSGTVLRNNLGVAPRYPAPQRRVLDDRGQGTVHESNQFSEPGFVSSTPTAPMDFRPVQTAASVDMGTGLTVIDDYTRSIRASGRSIDLGPYEF